MSIEGIIVGLLAILIGAAWATYGLKAFTILLPIWAFFVGLLAGAHWGQEFLGEGFFGTVTSWVTRPRARASCSPCSATSCTTRAIALLGGDRRVHPDAPACSAPSASTGSCRSCSASSSACCSPSR